MGESPFLTWCRISTIRRDAALNAEARPANVTAALISARSAMTDSAFSETVQVKTSGIRLETTISAYALDPLRLKISAAAAGRSQSLEISRGDAMRLAEQILAIAGS